MNIQQDEKHLQMIWFCILSFQLNAKSTISGLSPAIARKSGTIYHDVQVYVQARGLWMAYVQTEHRKHVGMCQDEFFLKDKRNTWEILKFTVPRTTKAIAVNM